MGTRICTKKLEKLKKLEGFGTQWSNLLDFAIFYEILNDLLGRWMAARIAFTTSEQKFFIFHVKFAKTEFFSFLEIFEGLFPGRINLVVPLWIQLSKYKMKDQLQALPKGLVRQ